MLRNFVILLCILINLTINRVYGFTIEVSGGEEGAIPIAIVPFGGNSANASVDIAAVINSDLRRTGHFAPLDNKDIISQPHTAADVRFEDWRLLGTENLLIGFVQSSGAGGYTVQFELFDVLKTNRLAGLSFDVTSNQNLRQIAHKIADIVYKQLTGNRGVFDTRIVYVAAGAIQGKRNRNYTLQIADADGYNSRTIFSSKEPILSPAWSPEGTRIAYVSFENRRPLIYVQDIITGKKEVVANYPGTNSAPSWSPDGRQLAVSLSKDGNPEIYIIDLISRTAQRLTNNSAIDTEPTWSPNGNSIVFTSDRGGSPQIYRVSANGGREERITFEGRYNAHPQFSPDGRLLTLVSGNGAVNHIAVLELEKGGNLRQLTSTNLDESPSFAPNGKMIIYASEDGGGGILRVVAVDGRKPQKLSISDNDVREPSWGPFSKTRIQELSEP